jgi:hypothetical protein
MLPLLRSSLLAGLILSLAACGRDEPPADAGESGDAASTQDSGQPPEPPQALPTARSSYERAHRLLTGASSLRFEAERTSAAGQTQYLAGVRRDLDHYFTVRTLPSADNRFDGTWLLQGGRYLRESQPGSFELELSPPDGHAAITAAQAALPTADTALLPADGSVESIAGVRCEVRGIDLSQLPAIAAAYQSLDVCVDEEAGQIVRIRAISVDGSRVSANFNGYGDPVTIPDAGVKAWWQDYQPR